MLPKWDLMTSLRYDFHRFTTDELERRGFSQTQGVSRVSLSVGLCRRPADEPPRPLDRRGLLVAAASACSDIAAPIRSDFYEWRLITPKVTGSGDDSLSLPLAGEPLPVRIWVEDAASLPAERARTPSPPGERPSSTANSTPRWSATRTAPT